ncbi:MAG: SGNH/GDSL hydrolase family protein [Actinobacteria bacterium]|nr:SGNH/GDSL hydrolase family protein [Actinomycetota bacterium]
MGDSITFGQYLDATSRWTSLVEEQLRSQFTEAIEVRSFNRGISGETTRMGLERFPRDVQEIFPDVMTLQFGLNDCNCWQTDGGLPRVSLGSFRANLVEMIDRARRFGARKIVLATNHRTLRRDTLVSGEVYECANGRYNHIIREVAETVGVDLCDIEAAFAHFDDEELAELLLPAPDLLHLSEAGNRVYFTAIWPHVERAVEASIQVVAT